MNSGLTDLLNPGRKSRQRHYKDERTIIEHEWPLMSHTRRSYHLDERHYQW